MINQPQTFDLCHTHTTSHTCANTLNHLQNKGTEVKRDEERNIQGTDDMTFMISGTIWSKTLQRQNELSQILFA